MLFAYLDSKWGAYVFCYYNHKNIYFSNDMNVESEIHIENSAIDFAAAISL